MTEMNEDAFPAGWVAALNDKITKYCTMPGKCMYASSY